MKDHPEYNEYATCYRCGFKKYCKLEGRDYADNGNDRKGDGIKWVRLEQSKQWL